MLVGLCLVAFILGWALSSYYAEQRREELEDKRLKKLARQTAEAAKKEEYLNYIWNSYD